MEVWQGPSLSQPRTEDYGSFTVLGVASFQFVAKIIQNRFKHKKVTCTMV